MKRIKIFFYAPCLVLFACLAFWAYRGDVFAVEPDEILSDPVLEKRARHISKGIRCVVCQNQSIDDSNADLARDMRLLVRARLVAGDSDQDVVDYLVSRYGDFVLLSPPFRGSTYVLWMAPVLFAFITLWMIFSFFHTHAKRAKRTSHTSQRHPSSHLSPLTDEENKIVERLLKEQE